MPEVPELPPAVQTFLDGGGVLLSDANPGRHDRVAVVRPTLRGEEWPAGVRTPVLGVWSAGGAITLETRPEWPRLLALRSRPAAGRWWTVLRFAEAVDVAAVLDEIARQSVWRDRHDGRVLRARLDAPLVGPLDERTLNPIGFVTANDGRVVDAATLDRVTPAVVAGLRGAAGVRVADWTPDTTRTVAALALAGVPVVADTAPVELGALLRDAITAHVDLADPIAREEHSLVTRRAAFDIFSSVAGQPMVSVVLATRRDDMLDFALAQVARQRGVDSLELVLAPHGFDVPLARVRDAVGPDVAVQVLPQPETTLFGDVLDAAARAAGGDVVLKMDDDDWYAPDVVADLLRARAYSGAELVGMPAELHYLAEPDLTVKRGHPVELYSSFVAGGTMLVDRTALREAGGFRAVRKYVDAQLIDALQAMGAAIYRTHGLGYVLRRNASGHTWQVDLDYLLDPKRTVATWPGFHPSRLLEPDPRHLP